MNKSLLTNLIALLIIVVGYFVDEYRAQLFSVGFFALSGAITNWIAIYMLFEKVPFLYGSGVIPNRFEEFKKGIKNLIMNEFFTDENVDRFFQGQKNSTAAHINFEPVINAVDFDQMFESLIELVLASKFGGMLMMIGAKEALEPLRPNFKVKMKSVVLEMTKTDKFLKALEDNILPS
ncbi:MAG: DUF445 domain-containing protein, partial [Candidatus Omnitrophica bacterium]|nr:DUF445 domain-containing protein [Candidatus Omnitrophota bacterium]